MPSDGTPTDVGLIGRSGWGDRKQAPTSVPPEMLMTGHLAPPTTSKYQRHGASFHGSPVDPRTRKVERSWACTGASPCGIRLRTSVGLMPRWVTPWSATYDHSRFGPG